jgi:hypothetical protein
MGRRQNRGHNDGSGFSALHGETFLKSAPYAAVCLSKTTVLSTSLTFVKARFKMFLHSVISF